MEKQEHIEHHKRLHKCLDELIGDFITQTGKTPSESSITELMTWSSGQIDNPTDA